MSNNKCKLFNKEFNLFNYRTDTILLESIQNLKRFTEDRKVTKKSSTIKYEYETLFIQNKRFLNFKDHWNCNTDHVNQIKMQNVVQNFPAVLFCARHGKHILELFYQLLMLLSKCSLTRFL